jgi:hypothetical protein
MSSSDACGDVSTEARERAIERMARVEEIVDFCCRALDVPMQFGGLTLQAFEAAQSPSKRLRLSISRRGMLCSCHEQQYTCPVDCNGSIRAPE